MTQTISFFTDTAELCVFDPACLAHRLDAAADWWTIPAEALMEVNAGNVMLVDVGTDGYYTIQIRETPPNNELSGRVSSVVHCVSGRLFIGPGEETTSGGCEPDPSLGGIMLEAEVGDYVITMTRKDSMEIELFLEPTLTPPALQHTQLLRL